MTAPTLELFVSAPGAQQVIALAEAVASLRSNIGALQSTVRGTEMQGLERLADSFREMRKEMVESLNGLRTDIVGGFSQMAEQVKAGQEKVEGEAKRGAVKIKAAMQSVDFGNGIRISGSTNTIGNVPQLEAAYDKIVAMARSKNVALEKVEQAMVENERNQLALMKGFWDERARVQAAADDKQKLLWIKHNEELKARLAEEATMMDTAVAKFREVQDKRLTAAARYQTTAATAFSAGLYSSVSPGNFGALKGDDVEKLGQKSGAAAAQVKLLAGQLNDAHSAARGLASGFDMMWLSWGNMAPLLAGAAIGHSVSQVVKLGAEFTQTFEIIRLLSEESVTSMNEMERVLDNLARNGPVGPLQIAEAMKTLSLAGLNASEVMSSIKDVMNFAVAGTTDMKTAADVLTTIASSFKISADNYNYIGDVISKAAAVSKSSVESFGGAMKQATTLNALYGVSLKDLAANVAFLSNIGIQNSAAGTAITNMYIDLANRTPKAAAALKQLGVQAIDPLTGKMKALKEVYTDVLAKLSEKTPTAQLEFINTIFTQRSRKDVIAVMEAMRTAAKEGGEGVKTEMDRIFAEIDQSAGFQAINAAILMTTPLNQMKSVVSNLQTTFKDAFSEIEPVVDSVSLKLRKVFQSDEFKASLERILILVADFVTLLANNIGIITSFGVALLGLKAAGILSTMFESAAAKVAAFGVASSTAAVGTDSLAVAQARLMTQTEVTAIKQNLAATTMGTLTGMISGGLSILSKIVPWITAAWGAWELYSIWTARSSAAHADFGGAKFEATLDALKREADRLEEVNKAKREGIALDVVRAHSATEAAKLDLHGQTQKKEQALFGLEDQLGNMKITGQPGSSYFQNQMSQRQLLLQKINQARKELLDAKAEETQKSSELDAQVKRIQDAATVGAQKVEQAIRPKADAAGTGGGPAKANKGGSALASSEYAQQREEIQRVIQTWRELAKESDEDFKRQEESVTASFNRGAINYNTYQTKLSDIAAKHEEDRMRIFSLETQAVDKLLPALAAKANTLDGAKRDKAKTLSNDQSQIANELASDRQKLEAGVNQELKRQQDIITAGLKPTTQLIQGAEQERATIQQTAKHELDRLNSKKDFIEVSEKEQFIQQEVLKGSKQAVDYAQKLQDVFNQQLKAGVFDDLSNPDVLANFNAMVALIDRAKGDAAELKRLLAEGAAVYFQNKQIDDARKKAVADFTRDEKKIEESLYEAISQGGAKGFKKLLSDVKSWFARLVLQPIIQPIAAFGAGLINPLGASSLAGGVATAGSTASGLSGLGSLSNFLGLGANLGMGSFGAGLATGASSLFSGNALGALGAAADIGGAGGLGMALGVAGPIALGVGLLSGVFGGHHGGPKVGGYFGAPTINPTGQGVGQGDNVDPQLSAYMAQTVAGLNAQYATIAQNFGLSQGAKFGLGLSTDPQGTAATYAEMTARTAGGSSLYSHINLNIGRSQEEMQAAVAKMANDALISALQQSNLDQPFKDYLNQVAAMTDETARSDALKAMSDVASFTTGIKGLGGAFVTISNLSVQARADLIQAAGGLQAIQAATQSYYNNFYSEEEKRQITIQRMNDTLAKAGLSLNGFDLSAANAAAHGDVLRAQFRNLVESRHVETEAGQKEWLALMNVADAFAQLTQATNAANDAARSATDIANERKDLEKQLLQAQNRTIDLRNLEREAIDASNRALYDRLQALNDAKDQLDKALQKEQADFDKQISDAKDAATKFRDISKSLRDYVHNLDQSDASPLTPAQKYAQAYSSFMQTYQASQGTGPDADAARSQLQSVSEAFLAASRTFNASNAQYTSDFNLVKSLVTQTAQTSDLYAGMAEHQVDLLTQQKDLQKQMVDGILNINDSVLTVWQAIANMGPAAPTGSAAFITQTYQNMLGRAPDNAGMSFWTAQLAMGKTQNDVIGGIGNSPEFISRMKSMYQSGNMMGVYSTFKGSGIPLFYADPLLGVGPGTVESWAQANGLPVFHSGTPYVPRTGFALLQQGERVVSRGGNDALVQEMRQLKMLMRAMIEANYDANERNARMIVEGTKQENKRSRFEQRNAADARNLA